MIYTRKQTQEEALQWDETQATLDKLIILGVYVVCCIEYPTKPGYRPDLVVKINGEFFDVHPGNWIVKDGLGNFFIYSEYDFAQLFIKNK